MAQSGGLGHIWIIAGPAGCGKITVAKYLAQELSLPYIEGDNACKRIILEASFND
jgi:gluconokinase